MPKRIMVSRSRTFACVLAIGVATGLWLLTQAQAAQTPAGVRSPLPADGISLVFGGDVLFGKPFAEIQDPDFVALFKIFQDADASFVNLEQVMSPVGSPDPDYSQRVRIDHKLLGDVKWAGIDAVSLSNNHSMNFGPDGLLGTISELEKSGIKHAGGGRNIEEAQAVGIVETRGLKVGLLSLYSGTVSGTEQVGAGKQRAGLFLLRAGEVDLGGARIVAPIAGDLSTLMHVIEATKPKVDVLVISVHMHWGDNTFKEEFADYHPLVARAAIDAGADLFVIHGPHVPRGIEAYKNGFIAYSVGNLFWNLKDIKNITLSPIYEEDIAFQSIVIRAVVKEKRIQRVEVIPIYLYKTGEYKGIPKLADASKGQEILERTGRLSAATRTKLVNKGWYGVVERSSQ